MFTACVSGIVGRVDKPLLLLPPTSPCGGGGGSTEAIADASVEAAAVLGALLPTLPLPDGAAATVDAFQEAPFNRGSAAFFFRRPCREAFMCLAA